MKNDEVDSVAALLGDLVAYRAQGASHLEVLAGNLPSQKFLPAFKKLSNFFVGQ